MIKIALAGNPNSGKTTLFNLLTGSKQRVGNWPGVTVDKKEGELKGNKDFLIEDLPGIYSLSPYTMEEVISRRYLVEEKPDLILNIVDASNFTRNLYLTSQLIELGIPTIIALNMMDVVEENGDHIDVDKLSKILKCPVVEISATKKTGVDKLIKTLKDSLDNNVPKYIKYSDSFENAIDETSELLKDYVDNSLLRFYSIKALENDSKAFSNYDIPNDLKENISDIREKIEKEQDDNIESITTSERYDALEILVSKVLTKAEYKLSKTDKIDKVVTSRVLGIPIFIAVMALTYFLAISTIGTGATDAVNGFFEDTLSPAVAAWMNSINVNPVVTGLLVDGAIAGVGAVLGFLPQMLVLFALLSILEDIGYMARVAFIMDRLFRKFGLSGKSFIPMMIGTGCSVPGIQASRTIESDRDRRITIMTTSFMPCSAKLPVIALIAGALFNGSSLVAVSMYFVGILAVIISGVILKKFKALASKPAPFVMELPPYHAPRAESVLRDMFNKGMSFIKRAGTVIFVSSIILWFLSNFDFSLNMVSENAHTSILASIGSVIAILFIPLGFGTWQAAVATITGFVAKENVVATLGIVLGIGAGLTEESKELMSAFSVAIGGSIGGYSFLLFNMLCMPCFAAVGAIKTEMNSAKWTFAAIAYQMLFAYSISFMFYNFANLIKFGTFNIWTVFAFVILFVMLYLIFRKGNYKKQEPLLYKKEYAESRG
ncbi:MAG: ferrous iron transport protein B [Tissierellia bacterium]|nr:ferrous iron transport protein B [Tissierellia bacterium]